MPLQLEHKEYLSNLKYTPGMIVRIKLTNFITYNHIELRASSKLNVVLGPNGTGKSTFLCAVVLGLGGKPSIIGRSPNVSDYIKRGCNDAVTELELFNDEGRNFVITRKIFSNNTSNWTVNGKAVPFKTVEAILLKFNILMNNLCQILPQDRVQDFAKMNKKELLEATQKAVGSGELYGWFEKMKSYRIQLLNHDQDLQETKRKFDIEFQQMKSMEGEVKSYQQKRMILDEIDIMKKKEAWLVFEAKNAERQQEIEMLQQFTNELDELQNEHKPFLRAIHKLETLEEKITNDIGIQENSLEDSKQKMRQLNKIGIHAKGKMANLKRELDAELNRVADKDSKIKEYTNKLQQISADMPRETESTLKSKIFCSNEQIEEGNRAMAALRNDEKSIESRFNKINQAVIANEHKLELCSNVQNKRIELLSSNQDAFEAYQWLNENRIQFTCNVYGPLFLEINIRNPSDAKYVEQVIPQMELIAFVFENNQDMSKMMTLLKDGQGLRINAVCSGVSEVPAREEYQPLIPLENLRQFGFTKYLIDLFDAPDPVLHWLCKQHNFHNIPVGSQRVDFNLDSIPSMLRRYFSIDRVYTVIKSRFSSNVTKTSKYVRDANLLRFSVDHDLINAIKKELNNKKCALESVQQEFSDLKRRKQDVEVKCNEAKNEKREYARILENLKSLTVRQRMIHEEMLQLQEVNVNIDDEKAKMIAQYNELVIKITLSENQILDLINDSSQIRRLLRLKMEEVDILSWLIREKQKDARQIETKLQQAKQAVTLKQDDLTRIRAECKDYLIKAKEATDGFSPDNEEFFHRFKNSFEKFANTLEGLHDQIGEKTALAKCIEDAASSQVLAEYEAKHRVLEDLKKKLSNAELRTSTINQQMSELRRQWTKKMQDLLSTINKKFEKCFQYLQCCGTVELDLSPDPEAVENYGLNIKVKFRSEGNLQALDPFTQSGGERSLSTAIYLLSLQSVINVPFRFVDEINQGMDAFNEVRVYYLISCAVSQEKSQYWLITPKLIGETRVSLETTVHVIYNGDCHKENDPNLNNSTSTQVHWSICDYLAVLRTHQ